MNHVYRIVWNQAKSCWQAVCETASTRSKNTSSRTVLNKVHGSGQELRGQRLKPSYAAVLCGLGLLAGTVSAGPTGGQVSAGTASITQSGATTTIQQASQKAAIDWTGFSVGKSESVRFTQPNASAITLNRVTGTERSEILGNLSANGQVFILNPNGVLFGKGAQVNVGGLVASTLRMSNEDFMAGNYKFTEGVNGSAAVVNEGRIQVAEGGVLALIAPVVTNTGTLIAPQGSVLMAGADAVTVTLQDGSLVSYTIDKGNLQALVDNGGLIQAEGGHVVLTAKGRDALSRAVVNHSGVIEAQTVLTKNGIVELLGDMEVGLINMSGKIDASAPNGGDGGFVETSAAKVTIQPDAYITTLASKGKTGKFLLDPTDLTIAKQGGDLTGAWVSGQLARNNVFLESTMGSTSGNGDVFVSDRISWSANTTLNILAGRNIQINAEIEALGSSAGVALTTGVLGGGTYSIGSGGRITLSGANASFALNGTPYKVIRNVQQLQAMKDDLLGNYVLGVDIDASGTSTWNGGKGFQPVGQGANNFMGVLDGLGHQVNGLYINRPSESEVGLIGSMEAMVRNIGVSGANITGLDSVGALAGQLRWGSSVSQSFASGKVTGRGNVGGLIGFATPYHYGVPYWCSQCIAINQSYADVAVAGQGGVGGLVGTIDQTSITNSYAVGNVSSPEIVGGLVGHNWSSYIVNSYSSGLVQGQASGVGGLVGLHNGNVINSHYDSQTSGLPGGNTTAEMKQQATFVGWDFNGVWRIVEGSSYPILRALTKDKLTLTVSAANETKVYNAEPWNPNPSDYINYAGFAGGDNPGSLSGVLRLEGAAIGAVDAGTYGYSGAGLSSQKYEISYLPGYLTITPSPISISGARPYDASNKAYAENVTSLNGVFNRDKGSVSVVSGSGVLSGANVGEWSLSSVDTLTLGGKAAGNYRLVEDGSKWIILPRPLIISPFDVTKTYGDPDPKFPYIVASGSLVDGDVIAGELSRAPGENAGNYAIQKGTLSAGSNYSIQLYDPVSHLVINRRPVSLTGERPYDGTNKAYQKDVNLTGVLPAGIVLAPGGYGYLDTAEVGNRTLVSVGNLELEGSGAGNYVLTTVGSQWTVKQAVHVNCAVANACSSGNFVGKDSFSMITISPIILEDSSQSTGTVLLGEGTTRHAGLMVNNAPADSSLEAYLWDPLIGEVVANSAAVFYGKIVDFVQANKFLSKTSINAFVASTTAKEKIKAALLEEAKKGVDLKDVSKGFLVSLVANAMRVGVKEWLEVSEIEGFFDSAMSWEVDQIFVLAQAVVTGGTPVSLLIAELMQTYEYVDNLIDVAKSTSASNEQNISNVAAILNGSASLLNKMSSLNDEEDVGELNTLRKLVLGNIDYLNNDLLPVIKFSYFDMEFGTSVVSGEKISKITKDLLAAKFYKLNGYGAKSAEHVRKTQDYAYLHKDDFGGRQITHAVQKLIAEMGLSEESVQIGPPSS